MFASKACNFWGAVLYIGRALHLTEIRGRTLKYVCACICMYMYEGVHAWVYMYAFVHTCMYMCVRIYKYIHTSLWSSILCIRGSRFHTIEYIPKCPQAGTLPSVKQGPAFMCMHVFMYMCVYVRVCVCTCVCTYVHVCVCICMSMYMYVYVRVCICT